MKKPTMRKHGFSSRMPKLLPTSQRKARVATAFGYGASPGNLTKAVGTAGKFYREHLKGGYATAKFGGEYPSRPKRK